MPARPVALACLAYCRFALSLIAATRAGFPTCWSGQRAQGSASHKGYPKVVPVVSSKAPAYPQPMHAATGEYPLRAPSGLSDLACQCVGWQELPALEPPPPRAPRSTAAVGPSCSLLLPKSRSCHSLVCLVHMLCDCSALPTLSSGSTILSAEGWIPTEEPRRAPSISPAPSNPTLRESGPYRHEWLRPSHAGHSPEPRVSIYPDHVERYY